MLKRVRQRVRASAAPCSSRLYQLAILAEARAAIGKLSGSHWMLPITVLLAVLLIIGVLWPAVWSGKPTRRKAALAVLDRLLRWRE